MIGLTYQVAVESGMDSSEPLNMELSITLNQAARFSVAHEILDPPSSSLGWQAHLRPQEMSKFFEKLLSNCSCSGDKNNLACSEKHPYLLVIVVIK